MRAVLSIQICVCFAPRCSLFETIRVEMCCISNFNGAVNILCIHFICAPLFRCELLQGCNLMERAPTPLPLIRSTRLVHFVRRACFGKSLFWRHARTHAFVWQLCVPHHEYTQKEHMCVWLLPPPPSSVPRSRSQQPHIFVSLAHELHCTLCFRPQGWRG